MRFFLFFSKILKKYFAGIKKRLSLQSQSERAEVQKRMDW